VDSRTVIASGAIKVGDVPVGATQVIPQTGGPEFEVGKEYYLFVTADVGLPITGSLTTP